MSEQEKGGSVNPAVPVKSIPHDVDALALGGSCANGGNFASEFTVTTPARPRIWVRHELVVLAARANEAPLLVCRFCRKATLRVAAECAVQQPRFLYTLEGRFQFAHPRERFVAPCHPVGMDGPASELNLFLGPASDAEVLSFGGGSAFSPGAASGSANPQS